MPYQQIRLLFLDNGINPREMLIVGWLDLARKTLPTMAAQNRRPISNDHCFIRVCLDTAIGQPWYLVVRRPVIRNLIDQKLLAAINVAESIVALPHRLDALNRQSIAWCKKMPPSDSRTVLLC
jgi:hypothetical protein